MPPRFSYWTIIAGGLPTAFRALEREELMPTFTRLREKHPDAEMKWFARGKLWDSPEAVRADTEKRRAAPGGAPDRSRHRDRAGGPPRDREWRPGGEHKDPRQKFTDAKTAKNVAHRRQKFARKHGDDRFARPPAPAASPTREWDKSRGGGDRPREGAERDRPPRRDDARPPFDRDRKGPPPAPPTRAWEKPRDGGRPEWRGKPSGSSAPKRDWNRPREGADRDRPPRRDDFRSRDDRGGRPAPPKRAWEKPRDGGPVPPKRERDRSREGGRPFQRKGFERNQGTEEPPAPPRPRGPNREPRPSEAPKPGAPPQPNEPTVPPPGPPERGLGRRRPAAEGGRLNRNKRRP
jgi:hypothetical protein